MNLFFPSKSVIGVNYRIESNSFLQMSVASLRDRIISIYLKFQSCNNVLVYRWKLIKLMLQSFINNKFSKWKWFISVNKSFWLKLYDLQWILDIRLPNFFSLCCFMSNFYILCTQYYVSFFINKILLKADLCKKIQPIRKQ